MASADDLKNQKEINKLKEEELRLEKEKNSTYRASLDMSYSLVESLKDTLGIRTKNTEFEKDLLKTSKEVNRALLDRKSSFSSISDLQKSIAKDSQIIARATTLQKGLEQSINATRKNGAKDTIAVFNKTKDLNKELKAQLAIAEQGEAIDEAVIKDLQTQIADNEALGDLMFNELSLLEKQYAISQLQTKELEDQIGVQDQINESLGVAGGFTELIGKIPGLGKFANQALGDVTKTMQEAADAGEAVPSKFGAMGMIVQGVGKNLLTKVLDPFTLITAAVTGLIKLTTELDKNVGQLARNMNVSYNEARSLNMEMNDFATSSDSVFVTTQGMNESLSAINATLGTNAKLNKDDLATFTKLREAAGLTNEELMGIQSLTLANGKSLEENTGEFLAQAKISSTKNGVILNEKKLLTDISKVSAATTLSLGKSSGAIANAAATAQSLGMELGKVDDIAGSLLDFESSIENELSAELLLNKDLNLEKARQAALNNDLATVAKEISEQAGSAAEFGEMNRIQQEALAKSVGMSREDLAQTLFTQEQLAGASGEEAEKRQKLLDARIEEVGLEQAKKELADGGLENLESQAAASQRLEATVQKISDLFMGIADTVLSIVSPVVDILYPVFNGIASAISLMFDGLKGIAIVLSPIIALVALLNIQLIGAALLSMAQSVWLALGAIPFIGPILATAATLAGAGLIYRYAKAGDVMSPADGKTQVSTKEGGLFELSPNDDLIAAPGAAAKMQGGGGSTVVQQDNSETNNLLKQLISTNQEGNSLQKKKPELSPVGLYEVQ
jgi:hypothetical protein